MCRIFLQFAARFLIAYAASIITWLAAHSYYESFLWFVTIKVSQIMGQPFSNPQIIGNAYYYRLGNTTFIYHSIAAVTLTCLITIPLLLASSGLSRLQRAQTVLIGLALLFVFHLFSLLIALHANIYSQYPLLLEKGVNLNQFFVSNPLKSQLISAFHRFINVILKYAVAVAIWIGLICYYKKSGPQPWVRKLL